MIQVIALSDAGRAEDLLRTLRATLDDATYTSRLKNAVANGYCILGLEDDGAMVGALGYRITFDLCWGKSLCVDDLVVAPDLRGGWSRWCLACCSKSDRARRAVRSYAALQWINAP